MDEGYFAWMVALVGGEACWSRLLRQLDAREFVPTLEMDRNRACDGTNLRYRYVYEMRLERRVDIRDVHAGPCSILEMMVALALRCEEHIMDDPGSGNRTGHWFWGMIESLGLSAQNDAQITSTYVDRVVYRFLNREYSPHGAGGLFTVQQYRRDLRTVEIWYQMMWYLNELT